MVLDEIERTLPSGNVLIVSHKAGGAYHAVLLVGYRYGPLPRPLQHAGGRVEYRGNARTRAITAGTGDRTHLRQSLRLRPGT